MFFLYMVEWLFPRELRRRGLELSIGPRFLCSAKCLPDNHLFLLFGLCSVLHGRGSGLESSTFMYLY